MPTATWDEWRKPGSRARIVAALVIVAGMWVVAAAAFAMFVATPIPADSAAPDDSYWSAEGMAWLSAAVALALGSAPIAHEVGGRRWLLVVPLLGAAVWAVGAAIAFAAT